MTRLGPEVDRKMHRKLTVVNGKLTDHANSEADRAPFRGPVPDGRTDEVLTTSASVTDNPYMSRPVDGLSRRVFAILVVAILVAALTRRSRSTPPAIDRDAWPVDVEWQPW